MYGYLVPCSGGEAMPLTRTKMYLGRKTGETTGPLNEENAQCKLELVEGWWMIDDLRSVHGLKVNGRACKRERLQPNDEIALGRHHFRIAFNPPKGWPGKSGVKTAPKPMAPPAVPASSDPGVLGRLIPLAGGPDYVLSKPELTFGRSPECDIVIAHSKISSKHGKLTFLRGHWHVQDLGSRNGIRVDGVKCEEAWVYPKSQLGLADCRFQVEYVARGDRPAQDMVVARPTQSLMSRLNVTDEALKEILARHPEEDEVPSKPRIDLLKEL
jgi:pSer/pThr/pTyr-binding forkhead associated (FHA) protein